MVNEVRIDKPLIQEISLSCRYDKEWKTHFLSLEVQESSPGDNKPLTELVTICINTKKERDRLLAMITKATAKIK